MNETLSKATAETPAVAIAKSLYEAFDYKKLEDKVLYMEVDKLVEKTGAKIRYDEIELAKNSKKYSKK